MQHTYWSNIRLDSTRVLVQYNPTQTELSGLSDWMQARRDDCSVTFSPTLNYSYKYCMTDEFEDAQLSFIPTRLER
jgi:homospermidine synthase